MFSLVPFKYKTREELVHFLILMSGVLILVLAGSFLLVSFSSNPSQSSGNGAQNSYASSSSAASATVGVGSIATSTSEREKKIYLNLEDDKMTFFKEGRRVKEDEIKGFIGFDKCLKLPSAVAREIYKFGEGKAGLYISGVDTIESGISSRDKYCVIGRRISPPSLSARAYFVGDLKTGRVLLKHNENKRFPIASLSKLMTASVFLEKMSQFETVRVSNEAYNVPTNGAGDLQPEDRIKTGDLIYPLILESSNVAAEVIARHAGRPRFIDWMNEKAEVLGLEETSFEGPSGLSPENKSCAKDLFKLSGFVYRKHPLIFNISKIEDYSNGKYLWKNVNRINGFDGFVGGKTGYIPQARDTNIALFKKEIPGWNKRLISTVILSSRNRERDTKKMLNYLKDGLYITSAKRVENKRDFLDDSVEVIMTGDIMLDRGVAESAEKNAEGDLGFLFNNARFLKKSDVAFGNLEGPASDKGRDAGKVYSFRMKPRALQVLKENNFAALNLANNHAGDWGRVALEDTIKRMKNNGIVPVGAGLNKKKAERVKIIHQNGYELGFVGFSDLGPKGFQATENAAGIVLSSSVEKVKRIVKKAKDKTDFLVVSFHFGQEYKKEPIDRQKKLARAAIDNGADVVVGHHPHVIQPLRRYKEGIIAYSLGNFIFDQDFSAETMKGLALKVVFTQKGIGKVKKIPLKINDDFQPSERGK